MNCLMHTSPVAEAKFLATVLCLKLTATMPPETSEKTTPPSAYWAPAVKGVVPVAAEISRAQHRQM